MVTNGEGSTEIAFFDVETTIPNRRGQKYSLLEFGSILVCPKTLVELENYSTLIRPADPSLITTASTNCNGITRDDVVPAPSFSQVADTIYNILHGRIWAGHNIIRFDCVRIKEAFAEINRPAPEPKGVIDSLALLTQRFGRRAGDMKMASLANYFGLGQQTHRSLDDVRMNLEVIKYCATVLFFESSLPDIFTADSWVSPNASTRSRRNLNISPEGPSPNNSTISSNRQIESHPTVSPTNPTPGETYPILPLRTPSIENSVLNLVEPNIAQSDPFNMDSLSFEVERESLQPDDTDMESGQESLNSITATSSDAPSGCTRYLMPDEVSVSSIDVVLSPYYRGIQRLQILHQNTLLHVCTNLKVRFGISTKFVDAAGRPKLSFVTDASPDICRVLDACDTLAQRISLVSGSSSDWRPIVTRKAGFVNSPTIRLHLRTVADGITARWTTEMYQKECTTTQRIVFSRYDVAELDSLFIPGTLVEAYFSLDPYDYQQTAGIRLVAKKLIIHSN